MKITQKRIENRIAFFNDRGIEIAQLSDGKFDIEFDEMADSFHLFAPDVGELSYAEEFAKAGLSASTARMIDAMPTPSATA